LFVGAADRARLAAIVADRSSPQKHVWRARVVLLSANRLGIQGGDLEGRLEALERRFDGIEDRREIQPKLNGGIRHAARP
jgi:hypothetical protein